MRYTLTLPYPPGTNNRLAVSNGRMVKASVYNKYATDAGLIANLTCKKPLEGDVRMIVQFYRPRQIGDIDAPLKMLLDVLTKIAYIDDGQICELHAYRFDCPSNPRAEVIIEAMEELPSQQRGGPPSR